MITLNTVVTFQDDRHGNRTVLTRIAEELAAHDADYRDLIFLNAAGDLVRRWLTRARPRNGFVSR